MTVSSKLEQVLGGLESAAGSFRQFAQDTQDQGAKKLYQDAAQQCEQLANALRGRLQYIQEQEPQYK